MAHRLIPVNMPCYNIADVSSIVHILVYLGIVIIHMLSLSKQWFISKSDQGSKVRSGVLRNLNVPYAKPPCTSFPDQASTSKHNLKMRPYMT